MFGNKKAEIKLANKLIQDHKRAIRCLEIQIQRLEHNPFKYIFSSFNFLPPELDKK